MASRGPPISCGAREVAACIVEAMRRRSDLGLNERCARRVVHERELRGELVQTVECVQVAEKLRRQTLVIDNLLGNARPVRVLRETCPCATSCALQVDRGDLPIRRRWTAIVEIRDGAHAGTPKRVVRLSRPVFCNADTMVFTTISGWPFARYCTRHSATEPRPFGFTSSVPV